ncbi:MULTISPECIES: DUF5677 domain-containing protein [Mesobacillus]|uniref:Uncharacterized protein n=2 Tax=Bacillota TaxID=1239 RepID=A0A0A8X344_MESS1|nr:DUF5677 domain-containing protein [Mesobacillus selenatarsenatis]GAM13417.1 hypothetical protein SAMD00020551_1561 [Mesobacillus selenatarsenatis SF-1]
MKLLKIIYSEADLVTQTILENHFDMNNSEREFDVHDAAIVGLFEDMVGKTNSLLVLLNNQSFNGADSLTRMIMENFIFLKLIFQRDSNNRARSYFYSLKLRQIKFFNTMIEQSLVGSEIRKYLSLSIDNLYKKFPKFADNAYLEDIETGFIDSLNHKDKNQKWYNVTGKINNFRALCKYLGYEKEYILLYQTFSSEVHALEATNYFKFDHGIVEVYRKGGEINTHVMVISNFLIEIIREMYSYYELKNEVSKFNNKIAINYKLIRGT